MNKRKRIFAAALTMLMVLVFCLSGCGKADISAYADTKIEVTGLTDEDFYITPQELSEMDCVSVNASGEKKEAGDYTTKAYGPTLQSFVEQYDESLDNFSMVRVSSTDDYTVMLGPVSWDDKDVILSIANGSEALTKDQQPMRIVIPDGKSGNWVRMVTKLEFVRK